MKMPYWRYYFEIIRTVDEPFEIIKYFIKRLAGIKDVTFSKDIHINSYGVKINCGRYMENVRVSCEMHEKGVIEEMLKIKEGIIIDVGGHLGREALVIGKRYPNVKVFSYEPNVESFELFRNNILNNKLHNVFISNKGVSDKHGYIKFYERTYYSATSGIKADIYPDSVETEIETISLDMTFLDKNIKLIKIDTEGMEEKVIKGAKEIIKKDKPIIIFEADNEKDFFRIKDLLPKFYTYKKLDAVNWVAKYDK